MGKVIKNPNPRCAVESSRNIIIPVLQESVPISTKTEFVENVSNAPQGQVIAMEDFDVFLEKAEQDVKENKLSSALRYLLNLEITDFKNLRVHELLANVYLLLGDLALAKEQCVICSDLMEIDENNNLFDIKDFDGLLAQAGNKGDVEKIFYEIMQNPLSQDKLFENTKVAFDLAAHHMAVHEYEKAEALLVAFRDKYTQCLRENKD